jgi:hypothetical protein
MKTASSHQNALQREKSSTNQRSSAGPKGIGLTPPAYGIESLDHALTGIAPNATIQTKPKPSEGELQPPPPPPPPRVPPPAPKPKKKPKKRD